MALDMQVGLRPGHVVLDGDPAPPLQKGLNPSPQKRGLCPAQLSAHVLWPNGWMDQDGTWHEGRPRPRPHCARWGPSSPSSKKGHNPPPIFGPCLLWPNGWMDQDTTWYGGRPQPRPHCVTWGSSSPKGGTAPPPIFSPLLLWPNGRPSQLLLSTCFVLELSTT